MSKKQLIVGVEPHSIAHKLHIKAGDYLLTVNHEAVRDIFDYRFLIMDELLTFEIEKANGKVKEFSIEKDAETDLGLLFEDGLMDNYRSCTNKCIFCFIDQMPKGMRETLYFKDDDSRLSFLQGNYVTLTNMSEEDIDRIIRYRMGPINISVHTTDEALRCQMLNNRFAGKVLGYLARLADADIPMNGQVVLCKGINDGAQLEKTIADLSRYLPQMQSLSVVPAGLTKYREGLFPIAPFTKEDARAVIKTVEKHQENLYNRFSTHFVHAADEFYLLAEQDLPAEDTYDGYPQLENGVGMQRLLQEEFTDAMEAYRKGAEPLSVKKRRISVATGKLAYPYMKAYAQTAAMAFDIPVQVYEIRNDFFGSSITVSGLICGQDLCAQLKGCDLGEELLLPVNMFRAGETCFLDDVTKAQVEEALQVKITVVGQSGSALRDAFAGCPHTDFRRQNYEQADCGNCRTT